MFRRQVGLKLTVFAVSMAFCLLAMEMVLRFVFPIRVVTIGLEDAPKADRYGWALKPHQLIRILDPDTGVVYTDYANSEGWRDRERTTQRRANTLRILVLGDSVTYGAIVRQVDTYTAILERKLRANGVDAEVINMSYGGWGTDQELEALTLEGVSYRPDLVILQFTGNDPFDVGYYASNVQRTIARNQVSDENALRMKPIYYELDESGRLQRHVNPLFKTDPAPVTLADRARNLAKHIELLRTPVMLYRSYQLRASAGVISQRADDIHSRPRYAITSKRIENVKLALHLDESASLVQALRKANDTRPAEDDLIAMMDRAGQSGNREAILRILNARWAGASFYPQEFMEARHWDPSSPIWRLQDAVITRCIQVAQQSGAKVALFNQSEAGAYAWDVYWFRVEDTARNRELYLSHTKLLAEIAKRENAWMIPNRRVLERGHNDPHPNARGNEAIADDIYDFLREDAKLIPDDRP